MVCSVWNSYSQILDWCLLCQVFKQYDSMVSAFERTMAEEFSQGVLATLAKSFGAKCCICCTHLLLTVKDKEKLRMDIQAEVQRLRKNGL